MSKREVAFLLVGLSSGLLLLFAGLMAFVWFHHMFIIGFAWRTGSVILAIPFLLIAAGLMVLRRG